MRKPKDDKESKELSQTKPKINKVSPITMQITIDISYALPHRSKKTDFKFFSTIL